MGYLRLTSIREILLAKAPRDVGVGVLGRTNLKSSKGPSLMEGKSRTGMEEVGLGKKRGSGESRCRAEVAISGGGELGEGRTERGGEQSGGGGGHGSFRFEARIVPGKREKRWIKRKNEAASRRECEWRTSAVHQTQQWKTP
ncbi:hypothetical protein ACLOJK_003611 [Asimina triloba]